MSDCTSCDRIIGMFDDHAVTLCGDCYHALVREKHELEEQLRAYGQEINALQTDAREAEHLRRHIEGTLP